LIDFLDTFSKNIQITNFMKIRAVGAKLFHADEQIRQEVRDLSTYGQRVHLVKENAVPVHAMKAHRGRTGIAPLILNLGVVNFKPQPL
jgi:hypothetical protein